MVCAICDEPEDYRLMRCGVCGRPYHDQLCGSTLPFHEEFINDFDVDDLVRGQFPSRTLNTSTATLNVCTVCKRSPDWKRRIPFSAQEWRTAHAMHWGTDQAKRKEFKQAVQDNLKRQLEAEKRTRLREEASARKQAEDQLLTQRFRDAAAADQRKRLTLEKAFTAAFSRCEDARLALNDAREFLEELLEKHIELERELIEVKLAHDEHLVRWVDLRSRLSLATAGVDTNSEQRRLPLEDTFHAVSEIEKRGYELYFRCQYLADQIDVLPTIIAVLEVEIRHLEAEFAVADQNMNSARAAMKTGNKA
jgi:hypothetical protein